MTTLHVTNPFNIQATLNGWFSVQINAITRPSWLPTIAVVFNIPETGIAPPSFSVFHQAVGQYNSNQGKFPGDRAVALMDVSLWVSRANKNWNAQLMTMDAMARKVFGDYSAVQVKDYMTNPQSPTAQTYKVNLTELESVPVSPDLNPDIERRRFLIRYHWTQQR